MQAETRIPGVPGVILSVTGPSGMFTGPLEEVPDTDPLTVTVVGLRLETLMATPCPPLGQGTGMRMGSARPSTVAVVVSVTLLSDGVDTQVVSMQAESGTWGTGTGPTVRLTECEAAKAGVGAASGRAPSATAAVVIAMRLPSRERLISSFPLSNVFSQLGAVVDESQRLASLRGPRSRCLAVPMARTADAVSRDESPASWASPHLPP